VQEVFQGITLGLDIEVEKPGFSVLHETPGITETNSGVLGEKSGLAQLSQTPERLCFFDIYSLFVFSRFSRIGALNKSELTVVLEHSDNTLSSDSKSLLLGPENLDFVDPDCNTFME